MIKGEGFLLNNLVKKKKHCFIVCDQYGIEHWDKREWERNVKKSELTCNWRKFTDDSPALFPLQNDERQEQKINE